MASVEATPGKLGVNPRAKTRHGSDGQKRTVFDDLESLTAHLSLKPPK